MRIALALAITTFTIAVIYIKQSPPQTYISSHTQSPAQTLAATATPSPTQLPTPTNTPTPQPSLSPTNTPTPSPSPKAEIGGSAMLIFPSATLISDDSSQIVYQTSTQAQEVGQWYKNAINDNYNVTNFVNVTANGQTTIKLSATNTTTNIKQDITISQTDSGLTNIVIKKS